MVKLLSFLFTFLLYFFPSQTISQIQLSGRVIEANTKNPIPYVNIGMVDKGIGTVSDEEGLFSLELRLSDLEGENKILFSALGYQTFYIPVSSLKSFSSEYVQIALTPSTVALDEVIVSNKDGRFISDDIGYRDYGQQAYGYWKDNIALGGELATKIMAKRGLRRLERLNFEVWDNPSDSLLLRVNVYDDDGLAGKPKTNLNKSGKNILCTVRKNDKLIRVDLTPYGIYVTDDFIISLELLKVFGEAELGLVLAASGFDQNGSFRKYVSQDKWERIDSRNMAYSLKTSLMVPERVAERYDKKQKRTKRKQQLVSGFVIFKGRMIPKVLVTNNRTGEEVMTDENGRYQIPMKDDDILTFSKKGFQAQHLRINKKPIVNVILKLAE